MDTHQHVDPHSADDCTDCGPGKRNRFYRGKTMRAEEFAIDQAYGIARRRLVNRSVLGWGVVYGYGLHGPRRPTPQPQQRDDAGQAAHEEAPSPVQGKDDVPTPGAPVGAIVVSPGFALDAYGREIVLIHSATLDRRNTFVIDRSAGGCTARAIDAIAAGRYLLRVHYAERPIEKANLPEECDCGRPEWRYLCESVLFSLETLHERCPCAERDCERECRCTGHDPCCGAGRAAHACLCQWVEHAKVASDPAPSCDWHGMRVDPAHGVALACVSVEAVDDKCAPLRFATIDDDCSPRRLVKGNDLLYDLVRGCDLTRIVGLSWGAWHRRTDPMPWSVFLDFLNAGAAAGASEVVTNLTVRFSGPVDVHTLTPDCFALRFTVASEDTGWYDVQLAPITSVRFAYPPGGDPAGTTREVSLCVDAEWVEEVASRASKFKREGAAVHIEVYGDYILDCHGQAVDANARGYAPGEPSPGAPAEPSGNGTPGGTLRSVFRIDRRMPD